MHAMKQPLLLHLCMPLPALLPGVEPLQGWLLRCAALAKKAVGCDQCEACWIVCELCDCHMIGLLWDEKKNERLFGVGS